MAELGVGPPADGRDREGAGQAVGDPGARRADGCPGGEGRRAPSRASSASCARKASPRSTSATGWRKSSRSRTGSRSCATGASLRPGARPTGRPRESSRRWSGARSGAATGRPLTEPGEPALSVEEWSVEDPGKARAARPGWRVVPGPPRRGPGNRRAHGVGAHRARHLALRDRAVPGLGPADDPRPREPGPFAKPRRGDRRRNRARRRRPQARRPPSRRVGAGEPDPSDALRSTGAAPFSTTRARARAAAEQVDALSIKTPSLEASAAQLSGGTQQKVVLGKWLLARPRVLLLDEPTRGIDVGAKAEIHEIVGRLAAEGVAVVLVSSDLPELLASRTASSSSRREGRERLLPLRGRDARGRHGGGDRLSASDEDRTRDPLARPHARRRSPSHLARLPRRDARHLRQSAESRSSRAADVGHGPPRRRHGYRHRDAGDRPFRRRDGGASRRRRGDRIRQRGMAALARVRVGPGFWARSSASCRARLVAWLRVPSFIVTLGGMLVFQGALLGSDRRNLRSPPAARFSSSGRLPAKAAGWALAGLLAAALRRGGDAGERPGAVEPARPRRRDDRLHGGDERLRGNSRCRCCSLLAVAALFSVVAAAHAVRPPALRDRRQPRSRALLRRADRAAHRRGVHADGSSSAARPGSC